MDVYQRRRLVALSALAGIFIVFVLLIRSCGGDDEEAPIEPIAGASGLEGATALTLEDYIFQADAICLESHNSLAEVDATDAAAAAAEQSEIVTSELQQLQTLPAPTEGAEDVDAFLALLEDLALLYEDKATAAERGDDTAVADVDTSIDETSAEVLDAAESAGFQVCGDPSQVGDADTGGDGGGGGGDETADTTDTGGTTPSDTPIVPETAPPTEPVTPPTDTGDTGAPAPPTDTPPADTGDDGTSGGVSP